MSLYTLSPTDPADIPGMGADALLAALDALDTGVILCDARGRLLLHNHAAQQVLADGSVLLLGPDGMLDVAGGSGLLLLRRAVHGAACQRSHHLVPLRHGEHSLMLAVQPLRGDADGTQRALLLIGRRSMCPGLAVQQLGRVFALTPAEVEVLTSLLAGVRIPDMAQSRGVKLSTVRTQVAALRAKLGVRRVDDILRLVAELPPMLGALGPAGPPGANRPHGQAPTWRPAAARQAAPGQPGAQPMNA